MFVILRGGSIDHFVVSFTVGICRLPSHSLSLTVEIGCLCLHTRCRSFAVDPSVACLYTRCRSFAVGCRCPHSRSFFLLVDHLRISCFSFTANHTLPAVRLSHNCRN